MKIKKPTYLKKETLARKIVQHHLDFPERVQIDRYIQEIYDLNKVKYLKYKDRMDKLTELYDEYIKDEKKFIEKYSE